MIHLSRFLSLSVLDILYIHTHTYNSITYNVDDDSSDNFSSRIQTKHYDDYIFEKIIIKQQKDIVINDDHESANVARRAEKTRRV